MGNLNNLDLVSSYSLPGLANISPQPFLACLSVENTKIIDYIKNGYVIMA